MSQQDVHDQEGPQEGPQEGTPGGLTGSQPERIIAAPDAGRVGAGRPRKLWLYFWVGIFLLAGGFLAAWAAPILLNFIYNRFQNSNESPYDSPGSLVPLFLFGAIIGAFVGQHLYYGWSRIKRRWGRMDAGDRITLVASFIIGIIISQPILALVGGSNIPHGYIGVTDAAILLAFIILAAYMLQSVSDILPWYSQRVSKVKTGIKILDTNVIIDGRIYDVANAGFLSGEIYVPKFVLEELQYIADNHDALKRNRGRRGLDVLRRMQSDFNLETGKYDRYAPDSHEPVDSRLVRIAKAVGADIVTNDWNLSSVARLQGVRILSLNELALTLRPNVLPGEPLNLSILREGNQMGQGVGYLDDGTMVVVENGREHIGKTMDVTVTQVIQTERGKMIFAEVEAEAPEARRSRRR